jgi:hypothetical protein
MKVLEGSVDVLYELIFEFPDRFVFNNDWSQDKFILFAIVACVGYILRHSEPFALREAACCDVMVRSYDILSSDD